MLINIPQELYEELQAVAKESAQSLEEMVLNHLRGMVHDPFAMLSADEQAELSALYFLSDDALQALMGEQMPEALQARAHHLLAENAKQTITPPESLELAALVERADRLMVRKAAAAAILRERGYTPKA